MLYLWIFTAILPAAGVAPDPAAAAGADVPATHDMAYDVGKQIRCPVCQGMPIAESPATMAQDMMRIVRSKLAHGESPEQIEQYFVGRYGDWVLLKPKAAGFSLIVWVGPPLALLLGFGAAMWHLRRLKGRGNAATAGAAAAGAAPAAADPYLQAIRNEVDR